MKLLVQRLTGCVMMLAASTLTFAHAQLDHASPPVGSQVESAPTQVKIWFDSDINPAGTSIQVLDASGKQVDKKDTKQDANDKMLMTVSLRAGLPDGTYRVAWKALCTEGHTTGGHFTVVVKTNH